MNIKNRYTKKAFTLIEILLTISIIGIMLGAFILILNSSIRLKEQRDRIRNLDIQKISSLIIQYRTLEGVYPIGITDEYQEICDDQALDCTGYLDLSVLKPDYIDSIPEDPLDEDDIGGTGYRLKIVDNNVWVDVINPESETAIEINN